MQGKKKENKILPNLTSKSLKSYLICQVSESLQIMVKDNNKSKQIYRNRINYKHLMLSLSSKTTGHW